MSFHTTSKINLSILKVWAPLTLKCITNYSHPQHHFAFKAIISESPPTLLLRCILKNSLDYGNCVLQFFKLVSDTPEQSNLLENLGSQIFDDFLCSAIKDCFGHGFVVGEKNARRAREKPDLGGFGVVGHGWVWLWSGRPWMAGFGVWSGRPWLGLLWSAI